MSDAIHYRPDDEDLTRYKLRHKTIDGHACRTLCGRYVFSVDTRKTPRPGAVAKGDETKRNAVDCPDCLIAFDRWLETSPTKPPTIRRWGEFVRAFNNAEIDRAAARGGRAMLMHPLPGRRWT